MHHLLDAYMYVYNCEIWSWLLTYMFLSHAFGEKGL